MWHARRGLHSARRFFCGAVSGPERQDVLSFWRFGAPARVRQALAGIFCARPEGLTLPGGLQVSQGIGRARAEARKHCTCSPFEYSGRPPPCGQVVGEKPLRHLARAGIDELCSTHGCALEVFVASALGGPSGQRCGVLPWRLISEMFPGRHVGRNAGITGMLSGRLCGPLQAPCYTLPV